MRRLVFYSSCENKMKGSYKIFQFTPGLSVVYNTQNSDFGSFSWEFYFEWLWFQLSFEIEFVKKGSYYDNFLKNKL